MGPKRDVLGNWTEEIKSLVNGASTHRIEHWFLRHGKDFVERARQIQKEGDLYWPAMPEGDHR